MLCPIFEKNQKKGTQELGLSPPPFLFVLIQNWWGLKRTQMCKWECRERFGFKKIKILGTWNVVRALDKVYDPRSKGFFWRCPDKKPDTRQGNTMCFVIFKQGKIPLENAPIFKFLKVAKPVLNIKYKPVKQGQNL